MNLSNMFISKGLGSKYHCVWYMMYGAPPNPFCYVPPPHHKLLPPDSLLSLSLVNKEHDKQHSIFCKDNVLITLLWQFKRSSKGMLIILNKICGFISVSGSCESPSLIALAVIQSSCASHFGFWETKSSSQQGHFLSCNVNIIFVRQTSSSGQTNDITRYLIGLRAPTFKVDQARQVWDHLMLRRDLVN